MEYEAQTVLVFPSRVVGHRQTVRQTDGYLGRDSSARKPFCRRVTDRKLNASITYSNHTHVTDYQCLSGRRSLFHESSHRSRPTDIPSRSLPAFMICCAGSVHEQIQTDPNLTVARCCEGSVYVQIQTREHAKLCRPRACLTAPTRQHEP